MSAPKGNRFWEARSSHGRELLFESPEILWAACCEYFQWVESSPLKEEKLFSYRGKITRRSRSKMRAMTISGLCLFLDISDQTWRDYRAREDFIGVIERVENVIWTQKFTGAAADLLNPNIIARELGLKDHKDISSEGGSVAPRGLADFYDDEGES